MILVLGGRGVLYSSVWRGKRPLACFCSRAKERDSGRTFGREPESLTSSGRHWRLSHAGLDALLAEGRIYWQKNGMPRGLAAAPYVPEERMAVIGDLWTGIDSINAGAAERLGYPTQKPVALLARRPRGRPRARARAGTGVGASDCDEYARRPHPNRERRVRHPGAETHERAAGETLERKPTPAGELNER
jgi:hypothetical protein